VASPEVERAMRVYFSLLSADGGEALRRTLSGSEVDPRIRTVMQAQTLAPAARAAVVWALRQAGQKHLGALIATSGVKTPGEQRLLRQERVAYREQFVGALDRAGVDVLICPPFALPALRHGTSRFLQRAASYTMLYNLLGFPAGTVAAGRVRSGEESDRTVGRELTLRVARAVEVGSAGLPVGVQVAGRMWREDQVLAVMKALEDAFSVRAGYPVGMSVPRA